MSGPWEDYKKKDRLPPEKEKKEPKKKEPEEDERGPWELYTDTKKEEQRLKQDFQAQGPDLLKLGAQGATYGHLDELQGVGAEMMGGDYTQARDEARKGIAESRKKTGLLGDVMEMGGSMLTSVAVPSLRGGTFIKEVALAGLQGEGEAEEMSDVPRQAGLSMAISAGTQSIVKGIANKIVGKPEDILANTAGARGINYRDGATDMKDPGEVAKRLDQLGFFKMGERGFDPNTKTFVLSPNPAASKLDQFLKPQTLDTFLERAEKATQMLGQQNQQLLKGKKIPISEVDNVLVNTAFSFIPDGADVTARTRAAVDLVQEIVADLRARGAVKGNYIDAAEVQKAKQFLQQKVHKTYKAQGLADITNDGVEARRQYATELDKLLDKYGGTEYAKNNDLMHDLFLQKEMIHNKSSRMRGESVSGAKLQRPTLMDHAADIIDTPMIGVGRARMGQALETAPGKVLMDGVNRMPVEVYNNHQGRKPQSVANLPEELIRTPLPRTTAALMEKKNFVLAKIAQMAPEMLEAVKDTYDRDPEMLSELAPVIAMKMPHFFERDKYNRFDGRIMSEQDKAKAIKDTLGDTRLSTIEQAKIISRLNKEGLYDR